MLQVLLLLFLFGFVAFVITVASFVRKVMHSVKQVKTAFHPTGDYSARTEQTKTSSQRSARISVIDTRPEAIATRKIFSKDEGEYVGFEEVK